MAWTAAETARIVAAETKIAALTQQDTALAARLSALEAKPALTAAELVAIASALKGVVTVNVAGGAPGTTTPPTGTNPPPAVTPPPVPDTNGYPLAIPAAAPFTVGEGAHSLQVLAAQYGGSSGTFVVRIDGVVVTQPFKPTPQTGMSGGDLLTIKGPWTQASKIELLGVPPSGLYGLFFNAANLDYNPLNYVGAWDSRGGGKVFQLPSAYISNALNLLLLGAPGSVNLPPPPPPPVPPTVVSGATINGVAHADATLGDLVAATPSGGTLQVPAGVIHESVGNNAPMTISGGGKTVNPGSKDATYTQGAILDATGVPSYVEGQGGFVPKADVVINGWEVTKFGLQAGGHDGTAGIRNNRDGSFRYEDCYLHHNQMGIGPHAGGESTIRLKNCLLKNNGLPGDAGYAHNIYSYATHLIIEGGVTSIAQAGSGDGHPLKAGGPSLEVYGKNYFQGLNTSAIDIPHGTASPFIFKGGTTVEKLAGDENTVIIGYCPESQNNGSAGGTFSDLTIIIPNDGRNYIILANAGVVTFDSSCRFLYTDATPVPAGRIVVQGGGTVNGLPA